MLPLGSPGGVDGHAILARIWAYLFHERGDCRNVLMP